MISVVRRRYAVQPALAAILAATALFVVAGCTPSVDRQRSKAGPGTISEALNAGLPMILYSRLPGQEDGNVTYVESEGAGVWAPHPEKIVATLRAWIENPQVRASAAAACRRLARPQAARQIAHILAEYVGIPCQPLA